jgi:hypothetical protein
MRLSAAEARERVCEMLRSNGRPDAAQRLENRTEAEWGKMTSRGNDMYKSGFFYSERLEEYVKCTFGWNRTREGAKYWSEVCDCLHKVNREL